MKAAVYSNTFDDDLCFDKTAVAHAVLNNAPDTTKSPTSATPLHEKLSTTDKTIQNKNTSLSSLQDSSLNTTSLSVASSSTGSN